MRLPISIAILAGAVLLPARAEELPRTQVYGGFAASVLRAPSSNASVCNGWNVSAARRLLWKLSAVADFAGYYGRENEVVNTSVHSFLFGPRFTARGGRVSPFVETMFGVSRLRAESGGPAMAVNAFTFAAGGGVDIRVTRRLSVRLVRFDYERRRFFSEAPDGGRLSAGIVFRTGR